MQLILKPTSHPETGEIIINDSLFAIGRHEAPFDVCEPGLVDKLSKRHARIFEQDGKVYIADLDSLNGTTVNGQAVGKTPVLLQPGDEICLAGYLCYQAEILGAAAGRAVAEEQPPELRLILIPETAQIKLEPIVVSRFPFLVNKSSDVFERYREQYPDELRYISRRHAHFFLREGRLCIEDLGSTNGTFVCGERLEAQARELHTGDTVSFGGEQFVYTVTIDTGETGRDEEGREGTGGLTGTPAAIEDVTRTTFVTSANTFLDIFCTEDEQEEAAEPPAEETADVSQPSSGWQRRLQKTRSYLREIRDATTDDRAGSRGRVWLIPLAVMLGVAALALGLYFHGAPEREVRNLLDQADYAGALRSASGYLAEHPDDSKLDELAAEAMVKAVLPPWLARLEDGDYAAADRALEERRALVDTYPDGQRLLEMMHWVTGLERFVAERGGPDSPTVMFEHEARITELLDWWEEDRKTHRRMLATLSHHVPEFEAMHAQVFSHLRSLRSQQSLDLAAIERLIETVDAKLETGDTGELRPVIAEFRARYPKIAGVNQLEQDLTAYLAIVREVEAGNWIKASQMAGTTEFRSPSFRARVRSMRETELPAQAVIDSYAMASADWRAGRHEDSIERLQSLAGERWGEVAGRQLADKRELLQAFERLQGLRGTPDYADQVLEFYSMLDPVEDVYFVSAIEGDFRDQRVLAIARADQAAADARKAWNDYRERGRISGLHRLEERISEAFRQRAALLKSAYEDASSAMRIYKLLNVDDLSSLDGLYEDIVAEVLLQRRSLTELAMVLKPSLLESKLDLLPVVDRTSVLHVPVSGLSGPGRTGIGGRA